MDIFKQKYLHSMEPPLGFVLVIFLPHFLVYLIILFLRKLLKYLTFIGPCIVIYSYNKSRIVIYSHNKSRIVIYSYNKSQRNALFLKSILIKDSTCFRQIYCPSSGVIILYSQQQVFVMLFMLTASKVRMTSLAVSPHN
jgi:hypothetical protein